MANGYTLRWNGPQIKRRERDAARQGLLLAVEHLLGVSNARVPIEEGVLERSGVASVHDSQLVGAVSYDTRYAVRQHEDLSLSHDEGRQAKYLESAMASEKDMLLALIAGQLRRGFRR